MSRRRHQIRSFYGFPVSKKSEARDVGTDRRTDWVQHLLRPPRERGSYFISRSDNRVDEGYVTDRQINITKRSISVGEMYSKIYVEWAASHSDFSLT